MALIGTTHYNRKQTKEEKMGDRLEIYGNTPQIRNETFVGGFETIVRGHWFNCILWHFSCHIGIGNKCLSVISGHFLGETVTRFESLSKCFKLTVHLKRSLLRKSYAMTSLAEAVSPRCKGG